MSAGLGPASLSVCRTARRGRAEHGAGIGVSSAHVPGRGHGPESGSFGRGAGPSLREQRPERKLVQASPITCRRGDGHLQPFRRRRPIPGLLRTRVWGGCLIPEEHMRWDLAVLGPFLVTPLVLTQEQAGGHGCRRSPSEEVGRGTSGTRFLTTRVVVSAIRQGSEHGAPQPATSSAQTTAESEESVSRSPGGPQPNIASYDAAAPLRTKVAEGNLEYWCVAV